MQEYVQEVKIIIETGPHGEQSGKIIYVLTTGEETEVNPHRYVPKKPSAIIDLEKLSPAALLV